MNRLILLPFLKIFVFNVFFLLLVILCFAWKLHLHVFDISSNKGAYSVFLILLFSVKGHITSSAEHRLTERT